MSKIQVLGITRFSYACFGGFQQNQDSIPERLAFLFQEARIEERFALFEHVTLPAIRAQSDPDFLLVVLTSQDIPEHHLQRLADLVEDIAQIAIIPAAPEKMRKGVKHAMLPFIDTDADVVAQFRLDDDDAVGIDFIASIRAGFDDLQKTYANDGIVGLDFTRGIILNTSKETITAAPVSRQLWTPALVVYQPPRSHKTIVHFPHHRLREFMPVTRSKDKVMFVRGFNDFNDSQSWKTNDELHPITADVQSTLATRFAIDIASLNSAISNPTHP